MFYFSDKRFWLNDISSPQLRHSTAMNSSKYTKIPITHSRDWIDRLLIF
jgi:hypothetical protein